MKYHITALPAKIIITPQITKLPLRVSQCGQHMFPPPLFAFTEEYRKHPGRDLVYAVHLFCTSVSTCSEMMREQCSIFNKIFIWFVSFFCCARARATERRTFSFTWVRCSTSLLFCPPQTDEVTSRGAMSSFQVVDSSPGSSVSVMETSNFAHVIFQNVGKSFPPQAPLECRYTLTPFITPNPKDWVGIFKVRLQLSPRI